MSIKKYFGTDGIRGQFGSELIHPAFMLKLGWAAGRVFSQHNAIAKVLIGKDTRISGYVLESALQAGLSAARRTCSIAWPNANPGSRLPDAIFAGHGRYCDQRLS